MLNLCWSDEVWTLIHTQLWLFNKLCYFYHYHFVSCFYSSLAFLDQLLNWQKTDKRSFWVFLDTRQDLLLTGFGYRQLCWLVVLLLDKLIFSDGIWRPGLDPNYYLAWRPNLTMLFIDHFPYWVLTLLQQRLGLVLTSRLENSGEIK